MQIKNYTPHPITLVDRDGALRHMPVDGPAPRLSVERVDLGTVASSDSAILTRADAPRYALVRPSMGAVTGLPAEEHGVLLIVSALVAEACPGRSDLLYPGEAVRDDAGRVVAARGLCAGPGYYRQFLDTHEARCAGCGDVPDPEHIGLAQHDAGTPGGLTGCGDSHQWEWRPVLRAY